MRIGPDSKQEKAPRTGSLLGPGGASLDIASFLTALGAAC